MEIRSIQEADIEEVIALWKACDLTRPWNDPRTDIALAQQTPTSTVLVGWYRKEIGATAMVGYDGHRGWVYYLAVDPALRGKHFGRQIMVSAEAFVKAQGAVKIELMVRTNNDVAAGFYQTLGYQKEEVSVLSKWLTEETDA